MPYLAKILKYYGMEIGRRSMCGLESCPFLTLPNLGAKKERLGENNVNFRLLWLRRIGEALNR